MQYEDTTTANVAPRMHSYSKLLRKRIRRHRRFQELLAAIKSRKKRMHSKHLHETLSAVQEAYEDLFGKGSYARITISKKFTKDSHPLRLSEAARERYQRAKKRLSNLRST